ncbi:SRPBCC family protein [Niallia endozanthoxylica]|uniref:SRPBCC family protein n=1 Tax=Niallia endozanthoxylica TaxID=2036016 RepID=A0A5J5HP97_9BACI|nr:SRPBCC family protein [Niallia endozanthoxylica]KAA9023633.1 SRPBCC family protein [Niallia endozanthoxylica]
MLAVIEKVNNGYLAQFERYYHHSIEEVWAYLTENDLLNKWFSELHIEALKKGGLIKFDMGDGTFEEMTITNLEHHAVLEFTWGEDIVRFELQKKADGCRLILKEKLQTITNHTPKDLAGWHICLDVIQALLDGQTIDSREEVWKSWYEKYVQAVEIMK